MNQPSKKTLLGAAVTSLVSAAIFAAPVLAADKEAKKDMKTSETEKCYGVNKCSGHGKCAMSGGCSGKDGCGGKDGCSGKSECAGKNKCAGQGWLEVPKGLCMELKDGSLSPIKAKKG